MILHFLDYSVLKVASDVTDVPHQVETGRCNSIPRSCTTDLAGVFHDPRPIPGSRSRPASELVEINRRKPSQSVTNTLERVKETSPVQAEVRANTPCLVKWWKSNK